MSESPEFKPAVSKMATSNQCDFYNRNGIKWMPINVTVKGKSKTPSYPASELYKTKCNQNDFKTLPDHTVAALRSPCTHPFTSSWQTRQFLT